MEVSKKAGPCLGTPTVRIMVCLILFLIVFGHLFFWHRVFDRETGDPQERVGC